MGIKKFLKALEDRRGKRTWKELAAELGISTAYLCDVLQGRREPGEKILEPMGWERAVEYREKP
jgi:transcriptional regulator with XRE-family HTH domain